MLEMPFRKPRSLRSSLDKQIERNRYNYRASTDFQEDFPALQAMNPLSAPYIYYNSQIQSLSHINTVHEVCAGSGQNTKVLLDNFDYVVATDISQNSLQLLTLRYERQLGKTMSSRLTTIIADIEHLPFPDDSIKLLCCAGGLSYGDNNIVFNELYRVLCPGGFLLCVDSLDNFPVYSLNRFVHFLLGRRTYSTLLNMPKLSLLERFNRHYSYTSVKFFGKLTFAFPILRNVLPARLMRDLFSCADRQLPDFMAFKFVMVAIK